MVPVIEVQSLKKYFTTPRGMLHAVDDVTLQIQKGETLGVVGESGCGKSTLGRTIIHLLERTEGRILLNGIDISDVKGKELRKAREKMQIIFQDPYSSLDPRKTVEATIKEPLRVSGMFKRDEIDRMAGELMELVGIDNRLRLSYPHELDGGRRQRVGIARALALNPDFVVCDEPVSALDVSIQAQVINLLNDLRHQLGLTILFIAHDLSVVKYFSDRIGVMYFGKMVELATSDELFAHPLHPYTRSLLSAIPLPDPVYEKKRVRMKYDPLVEHDYSVNKPSLREVGPGHWVMCNDQEEARYRRQLEEKA